MSRALASLLFLLCHCSLFVDGAVPIHLGVVVNTASRIGKEQKIAIETAVNDINSSNITTLFLDPLQANANATSLIGLGLDALIATGTWPEVLTVAGTGSKESIPVISLATTSPTDLSSNPFLVRMSYPASSLVRCLAEVVKSFNWRRVIVIYEDDEYGSVAAIASILSDALNTVRSDIIDHISFPPMDTLSNPKALVQQELKRINQSVCKVYIILECSRLLTDRLFEEAKELGMMEKGHVWIASDDVSTLLHSTLRPSFMSSHTQRVVGIKSYFNETSDLYQVFYHKFQRRFNADYGSKGETFFEPGKFAVRAYDAVQAIAKAAVEVETKTILSRNPLLDGILSSNFTGLSGPIWFRSGGLPEGNGSSAFRVVNVAPKCYQELGFWLEGFGFYEEEGEMVRRGHLVDALSWPRGPNEKVPGGWGKLKIGVPARTAFDQFVKVTYEGKNVAQVTGFCIEVFNETLKRLKYDLEYEFFPFNGTYDDLVDQIPSQVYDAVVGDITILANRSRSVTFTEPILSSGLSMLVRERSNHTPWMLTKPFTWQVWLLSIASLIYMVIIVWCLEHRVNPEFKGPWWTQLGAAFGLIFSTIFFKNGSLYNCYTKIVVVVWIIGVLILASCFTANLSSILTVEKLEPVEVDGKVGCDGDSFVLQYIQHVLGYKKDKIEEIEQPESYIEAFRSGNITAAFLEVPYMRVFLSKYNGYTVHGETHMLGGFGFVFPKGSPMAEDFSQAILELTEDGTRKNLEDKWFSFTLSNCLTSNDDEKRDSLSLESFWALFLLIGGISTIVLLIFMCRSTIYQSGVSLRERFNVMRRSKNSQRKGGVQLQRSVAPAVLDQEENATSTDQRPANQALELHHHACDDIEQSRLQN